MRSELYKGRGAPQAWYRRPTSLLCFAAGIVVFMMVTFRMDEPALDALHEPLYMAVDMHTHTTESDGDLTAEEQIDMARKQGMTSLWITDHDMIRELPRTRELMAYGEERRVQVSFGVEITVGWYKKEHHLLGYFPDSSWFRSTLSPEMVKLQKACAVVKGSRELRNQNLVSYLNGLLPSEEGLIYFDSKASQRKFKPLVVSEVGTWAQVNANLMEPTSLGRPHFRAYLMSLGVREDLIFGPRAGDGQAIVDGDNAYYDDDRKGKKGTPAHALMHSAILESKHIVFKPLPILEAIAMIGEAGGRAVVAHLPTLGSSWHAKFADKFEELKEAGLWGVEAFSSEISPENHALINQIAVDHGLQITAGSDSHGTLKVYAHLGDVHRHKTSDFDELSVWARIGHSRSEALRDGL